jgi:hypothetical protein
MHNGRHFGELDKKNFVTYNSRLSSIRLACPTAPAAPDWREKLQLSGPIGAIKQSPRRPQALDLADACADLKDLEVAHPPTVIAVTKSAGRG